MIRRYSRLDSTGIEFKDCFDHGDAAARENRWSFEIAWEVANKVGGIYTVIRSKAYVSTEELGEQFCLLGPYKEHCARAEVEEVEFSKGPLLEAVNTLRYRGYKLYTGRWLVDGNPQLILFDIASAAGKLDQFKTELWNNCRIGTEARLLDYSMLLEFKKLFLFVFLGVPYMDAETNDAIILAYVIAEFLEEVFIRFFFFLLIKLF